MITLKSIKLNGGATLNKAGEVVNFKTGFQIGKQDLFICPVYKLHKRDIIKLLNELSNGENLGIWIVYNKAYVDISERIANRAHALRVGRDRKQISVWSWKKGEAIYC